MPFLSKNSHKSITFEHHNTYVSLERPFFRLAVLAASVWAPFSSSSSKFPSVNVTGFIILSAVSLVSTRSICRARWKSAGPKGRPGSKDGKVKENVINFVIKSYCEVHSYQGCCVLLPWRSSEVRRRRESRGGGRRGASSWSRTGLTLSVTVQRFSGCFVSKANQYFFWPFCLGR